MKLPYPIPIRLATCWMVVLLVLICAISLRPIIILDAIAFWFLVSLVYVMVPHWHPPRLRGFYAQPDSKPVAINSTSLQERYWSGEINAHTLSLLIGAQLGVQPDRDYVMEDRELREMLGWTNESGEVRPSSSIRREQRNLHSALVEQANLVSIVAQSSVGLPQHRRRSFPKHCSDCGGEMDVQGDHELAICSCCLSDQSIETTERSPSSAKASKQDIGLYWCYGCNRYFYGQNRSSVRCWRCGGLHTQVFKARKPEIDRQERVDRVLSPSLSDRIDAQTERAKELSIAARALTLRLEDDYGRSNRK